MRYFNLESFSNILSAVVALTLSSFIAKLLPFVKLRWLLLNSYEKYFVCTM